MGWDQAAFRGAAVNGTLDPYYVAFLEEGAPTVTPAGWLAPTLDLGADLSGHLISGLTRPCVVSRPALISSRRAGKFLNGQRRDIPLAHPYLKGVIGVDPGEPDEHLALLQAATVVTGVWIVTGGAYPSPTPAVWPYRGANAERWQRSTVLATSVVLAKQTQLSGAELISGAMRVEIRWEGRLSGPRP